MNLGKVARESGRGGRIEDGGGARLVQSSGKRFRGVTNAAPDPPPPQLDGLAPKPFDPDKMRLPKLRSGVALEMDLTCFQPVLFANNTP